MKKLERLACLYLTFLNSPAGVSFASLRRAMPGAYSGDLETARRKFERDKKDLKRLGMELRYYADGALLPGGSSARGHTYVPLDPPRPLPESRLSPAEAQILSTLLLRAVARDRTARPERCARLESAMLKLLYRNPADLVEQPEVRLSRVPRFENDQLSARLALIHTALRHRRLMRLSYPKPTGEIQERPVEPRGLIAHRGRWCLIGYCRQAQGYRSFYVDRMQDAELTETRVAPDAGFRLREYSLHPLALRLHEPVELILRLAPGAERAFEEFAAGVRPVPHVSVEVSGQVARISTTNRGGLFQWLLRNPDAALQLGPEQERRRYAEMLDEMIALSSEVDSGAAGAGAGGR